MLRSTFLRAADGAAAAPTLDAGRMAVALAFYPAIDRALALYLTLDHGLPHTSASPQAEPTPPPPPPPTPSFASVVTRHMRFVTTSCKLIIATMLACNFAGDLRAAREEETGRGICPSSLFNSASLVNSPPSSRRFSPWRSYHGRPPLYFPSAAARLATVPPIHPGPTRPAIRRPTPRAPPPPRLPSRTTPAPSAVPFTSAVASDFQCDAHNRAFEGIFGPPAPGLLSLADAAIRHRLSASAPPPPPTADQRRANMLSLADEVLRLSSSGSPAAAATPLPDAAADPPLLIPPPPPPEPPPDGRLQLDLVRDLVDFVDTFDGLPPPALTRSIATSCGCKKAEASTHRAIACAAYAALHPDEPANNAPANIAGSKRSMVTWRAKLRPALLLIMRERRVAALGSSAQLRAEKPEERGDGKEASALGTSASFIRCIPCTNQAGHRWLVDCRYEPPRCGAVWCGQVGCDVTIRCDCADPPAQESQPVVHSYASVDSDHRNVGCSSRRHPLDSRVRLDARIPGRGLELRRRHSLQLVSRPHIVLRPLCS